MKIGLSGVANKLQDSMPGCRKVELTDLYNIQGVCKLQQESVSLVHFTQLNPHVLCKILCTGQRNFNCAFTLSHLISIE